MSKDYELVGLKNGASSVRSLDNGETFHPVAGPIAEAEALYVRQLRLRERVTRRQQSPEPGLLNGFVIWDVGLGAGANALTAIRQLADIPAELRVVSFDRTLGALVFAQEHATALEFPLEFEDVTDALLRNRRAQFRRGALGVHWEVHLADFPDLMAGSTPLPAPDAIFFDAFSPARNPEMWTLPLFENLFRRLDPQRPCSLATFSRSTMVRVAMLLAGFYVGIGESIAAKEETTIAANFSDLICRPLDLMWLERAKVSRNAEPLCEPRYTQQALSSQSWERLRAHPQFN